MDICFCVALLVGSCADLMCLIFFISHRVGSTKSALLLRTQSTVDFLIAVVAAIAYIWPSLETGMDMIDAVLCKLWNCRCIFWTLVTISVYILILTSLDRFFFVHRPLSYRKTNSKCVKLTLSILIPLSVGFNIPGLFECHYEASGLSGTQATCHSTIHNRSQLAGPLSQAFSIAWVIVIYFIPSSLIVTFNALNIRRLRHRQFQTRTTCQISMHLVIATVILAVCYIVLFSLDSLYFFISRFDRELSQSYYADETRHAVGVFMVSLNACINPFVYLVMLTSFRKFLFKPCQRRQPPSLPETSSHPTHL